MSVPRVENILNARLGSEAGRSAHCAWTHMYLWIVDGIHSGDRCEADHGCMQVSIDFLAVMSTSPRGRLDALALKMQLPCCCMQDNSTKEMGCG